MGFLDRITGKVTGTIRMAQGNADLAETGIEGTASILSVTDTGRTIGLTSVDGYSKTSESELYDVRARITLPGRDPYEVEHRTTQAPTAGSDVTCFVDPDDDQRVHYQEQAWGAASTTVPTDTSSALAASLAADPNAAASLRQSLSALLGRPVGESPEELAAAMQEAQEVGMKMATQHQPPDGPTG